MVPTHIARQLDQPLTKGELRETIFSLKGGKNPSLDGIPNEFFQSYHDFLIPCLLRIWKEALRIGVLLASINTSAINSYTREGGKRT